MATGEAFITDEGRQIINRRFAPLTVDMETAAIAHVCHVNSIPFLAIRTVTDTADHRGAEQFEQNAAKAAAITTDITMALLAEMKKEA
jgi:adenosylhomocysteine nucleosidase